MRVEDAIQHYIGRTDTRFDLIGMHWDGVWSRAGGPIFQTNENPFGYAAKPGLISSEVNWYFDESPIDNKAATRVERLRLWLAPVTHAQNVVGALIGLGTQYWLAPLRAEGVADQDKHVLMLADSNGAGITVRLTRRPVK